MFESCENKAWKKFRSVRDLNPWPLRCSALPTELTSQLGPGHYVGSIIWNSLTQVSRSLFHFYCFHPSNLKARSLWDKCGKTLDFSLRKIMLKEIWAWMETSCNRFGYQTPTWTMKSPALHQNKNFYSWFFQMEKSSTVNGNNQVILAQNWNFIRVPYYYAGSAFHPPPEDLRRAGERFVLSGCQCYTPYRQMPSNFPWAIKDSSRIADNEVLLAR